MSYGIRSSKLGEFHVVILDDAGQVTEVAATITGPQSGVISLAATEFLNGINGKDEWFNGWVERLLESLEATGSDKPKNDGNRAS